MCIATAHRPLAGVGIAAQGIHLHAALPVQRRQGGRFPIQRGGQVAVLQQPAQALGAHLLRLKQHLAGAILVPHLHGTVGLHPRRIQIIPHPGITQQPMAGFGKRGHPQLRLTLRYGRGRRTVQHGHLQPLLRQQHCQQPTGHATANDDDVLFVTASHIVHPKDRNAPPPSAPFNQPRSSKFKVQTRGGFGANLNGRCFALNRGFGLQVPSPPLPAPFNFKL